MSGLSRPLAVARIGAAPYATLVEANPAECAVLAERMLIPAVLALSCAFVLRREGDVIRAEGRLRARVVRTCVITLDDFETDAIEDFAVLFVPQGSESGDIDPAAEDEIPYSGQTIDPGEAAAEQLALALDPYPRRPGAEMAETETETANPFAKLGERLRPH